jgi:probable rRNA maturation factor
VTVTLQIRNESRVKNCYRSDVLRRIAERICTAEKQSGDVEVSVLFCDDQRIRELNRQFRKNDRVTDVLSFAQNEAQGMPKLDPARAVVLGDIVISLETVAERRSNLGDAMRDEVKLLFCHGLLHLFGYDHGTENERRIMTAKHAEYLNLPLAKAWPEPGPRTVER